MNKVDKSCLSEKFMKLLMNFAFKFNFLGKVVYVWGRKASENFPWMHPGEEASAWTNFPQSMWNFFFSAFMAMEGIILWTLRLHICPSICLRRLLLVRIIQNKQNKITFLRLFIEFNAPSPRSTWWKINWIPCLLSFFLPSFLAFPSVDIYSFSG